MTLAANRAIYEKILHHMADGVISLDLDGRVVTFNPAAARLLDIPPEEPVGRPYAATFLAESRFDQLNDLVLKAILEAEIVHSEAVEIAAASQLRHLNVSTSFLRDGAEPVGVIVVLSDVTEEHRRLQLKRLFGEYLDPRIIDRLSAAGDGLDQGVRQTATVAFLDLEGFTGLGERLGAVPLVRFLNLFLAQMSEPIRRRGGITDKYIGDAILSVWSPTFIEGGQEAGEACHAAIEQRRRLDELARLARDEGIPGLDRGCEIRIGIATGEVVAGSIGPAGARNYTVVGDTVNLAARLEAANKRVGTRILADRRTRAAAGPELVFRELGALALPGKAGREPLFELLGPKEACAEATLRLVERYGRGLAACRAGDTHAAQAAFADALAAVPDDRPSRAMLEHLAAAGAADPGTLCP
ncbi:MAG: adenylate/guanylate cyclase domain-containing protein [Geminicoccaceae bacterium]